MDFYVNIFNSFLIVFIIWPGFFTEYGIAVLDSIDIILAFYFVGCLNYSAFRAREMIEDYFEEEIFQSWLLAVFNIWYLQYKINRLVDAGEIYDEKGKTVKK